MEQNVTTTTTKGIVISLILIVLGPVIYFLDIDTTGGLQYLSYIIFMAGIIWSIFSYGKQVDHNSTFGGYFVHGFKIAALVTSIMIIYVIIFILLFPEFKEKALEKISEALHKQKLPQERIEAGLQFWKKGFVVITISATLLFYIICGAIASLVGAAITKKNPRPIEIDR